MGAHEFKVAYGCAAQQAAQLSDMLLRMALEIGHQLRVSRGGERRDLLDDRLVQASREFGAGRIQRRCGGSGQAQCRQRH